MRLFLDAMFAEDFDPVADVAANEAAKKAEAEKEEKKKAEAAAPAKDDAMDLPQSEEVSQDDIDALFG